MADILFFSKESPYVITKKMEYPNLIYNIKEENVDIEIKQEEISFELIEEEEESCLVDEIKEEISLQNDIKEEDDRNENNEIYQMKMTEFINAEEQIDEVWTDPPGHEADPLALIPVIETKIEPHSTEDEHISITDVCRSTSQNSDGRITVKFIANQVTYKTNFEDVKNWNCLQAGDIRNVRWSDGRYYPARIMAINSRKHVNNSFGTVESGSAFGHNTNSVSDFAGEQPSTSIMIEQSEEGNRSDCIQNTQCKTVSYNNHINSNLNNTSDSQTKKASNDSHIFSCKTQMRGSLSKPGDNNSRQNVEKQSSTIYPICSPVDHFETEFQLEDSIGTTNNDYNDEERYSSEFCNSVSRGNIFTELPTKKHTSPVLKLNDVILPVFTPIMTQQKYFKKVLKPLTSTVTQEDDDALGERHDTEKDKSYSPISIEDISENYSCLDEDCNITFEDSDCSNQTSKITGNLCKIYESVKTIDHSFNKKSKKNKNFCFLCETMVLDFSRHIERNHSNELEVQKIITIKKGAEKNNLIATLRKKGNFINAAAGNIKPVKKLKTLSPSKVKACPYCLGYYARNRLWRHKNICPKNDGTSQKIVPHELFPKCMSDDESEPLSLGILRRPEQGLPANTSVNFKKTKKIRAKREIHEWTNEQRKLVASFFQAEISGKIPPKKEQVNKLYKAYPDINFPSKWEKIKAFVQNIYTNKTKIKYSNN